MSVWRTAHQSGVARIPTLLYPSLGSNRTRYASTTSAPASTAKRSSFKERQRAERDQLIKVLKESPGKRDARNFLKHFDTPTSTNEDEIAAVKLKRAARDAVETAHHNEWRLTQTGVNLGNLYEPTKAIQDNPVFTQRPLPERPIAENVEPLHLALVKLRQPQMLDDGTLGELALTLSQMARLGLNIAVVVDCDDDAVLDTLDITPAWIETITEQSARIVDALEEYNEPGAFEVDHALVYAPVTGDIPSKVQVRGRVEVKHSHLLLSPIQDGIIPVIPPWAYDSELKRVRVRPDEVLLALTREFAGITAQREKEQGISEARGTLEKPLLDRIIILDPAGGLPSDKRQDGHIFVNLEAEYEDVRNELQGVSFGEQAPITSGRSKTEMSANRHVDNLDAVQKALKLLPPSSSALIITPTEAASSSQVAFLPTTSTGVRTRRSKNPLIHNLLTDKPMTSSSLPAPLVSSRRAEPAALNPATFLKRGIPVTLVPDPRISPWRPPSPENPSIDLANDPRVNFPKLVDLIEDSFRRKLDARHYLERIKGRVAGLIVAGDYEGGAICTWETPPGLETAPPPDSPLWVPYLDKFAVLTSSQGSGGVADIVWNALTLSCFPHGLVWRSRTSNPVNKWYFERTLGMWNLPDGQWTMFWTTNGVVEEWAEKQARITHHGDGKAKDMCRWDAYVDVCGGIAPSWADNRRPD